MHAPTRELLNNDVAALDVPSVPKGTLNSAKEDGAYAPIPMTVEPWARPKPTLPDAYAKGVAWDEEQSDAY